MVYRSENPLIADDLPETVVGDQVRLLQVPTNLLANAVKYTERGEVPIYYKVWGFQQEFVLFEPSLFFRKQNPGGITCTLFGPKLHAAFGGQHIHGGVTPEKICKK